MTTGEHGAPMTAGRTVSDGAVSRRAPGKLYVAGEYAVVEPGHRAVLVAVNRFITVTVSPVHDSGRRSGRIASSLYAGGTRSWRRRPEDGTALVEGAPVDYVLSAIRLVESLVRERGGELRLFDLDVDSQLDDASGRKLGLGSSAAVTVATVRSVAAFYGLRLTDTEVYKLCLLASDSVEPIGSAGDLAASTFTGWVDYSSPDRIWMREERVERSVDDMLLADWPGLRIERLEPPVGVDLLVGWTGDPASTAGLVADVQHGAHSAAPAALDYEEFLAGSQACLAGLVRSMESGDLDAVAARVQEDRTLLAGLAASTGVTIETPLLTRLVEIAREHGAAAKSSGAGGGDCGIALCPPHVDERAILAGWMAVGVVPLDLAIHTRDPRTEDR
ncbi:phosphomevalonate kinase [Actinomyces radicidentis]|uniref:phosphomevalonate kinase n=1 Tax=Actinomyces radicidentis TaxID=111015 RepID=UPI0034A038EE